MQFHTSFNNTSCNSFLIIQSLSLRFLSSLFVNSFVHHFFYYLPLSFTLLQHELSLFLFANALCYCLISICYSMISYQPLISTPHFFSVRRSLCCCIYFFLLFHDYYSFVGRLIDIFIIIIINYLLFSLSIVSLLFGLYHLLIVIYFFYIYSILFLVISSI